MAVYLFAHTRNRPGFRDGDEFKREMHEMQQQCFHPSKCELVECRKKNYWLRRKTFLSHLHKVEPTTIALFCHGSKHWIYGIGYNRDTIQLLAQYIKESVPTYDKVHIILYACSCGKGKGNSYPVGGVPKKAGVAMMLADHLAMLDVRFKIMAHTTRGHTTRNPNCVFIELGGGHIIKKTVVKRVSWWQGRKNPKGRKRWLEWVKRLRTDRWWRFKFSYRDIPQIHAMLDGEPF
jgi:hypothetical protein